MARNSLLLLWVGLFLAIPADAMQVLGLRGEVFVDRASQSLLVRGADLPFALLAHDVVRTSANSGARVRFTDGTELSLGSQSRAKIADIATRAKGQWFSLIWGRARVLVQALPRAMPWTMTAQDVAMGVRGTEFYVEAEDGVRVCTLEGDVDVTVGKTQIALPAGFGFWLTREARRDLADGKNAAVAPHIQPMRADQMDWWRWRTLVDASESMLSAARGLDRIWFSLGSDKRLLSPEDAWERNKRLSADGGLRTRGLSTSGGRGRDGFVDARSGLLFSANRRWLLGAEVQAVAKSGHLNPEQAGVSVLELESRFQPWKRLQLRLGRQAWSFGDGFMVGENDWATRPRRFDGLRADIALTASNLSFFSSSLDDRVSWTRGEDWLNGFYLESPRLPIQVYGFQSIRSGNLDTQTYIIGERVRLERITGGAAMAFLEQEFAYQIRRQPAAAGTAYSSRVELGQRWQWGSFVHGLSATWLRNTSFSPLFPDTHRFFGLLDAFGARTHDLQRWAGGASAQMPVLGRRQTLRVDLSWFHRFVAGGVDPFLGREADVWLASELMPGLEAQFGVARLWGGALGARNQGFAQLEWRI